MGRGTLPQSKTRLFFRYSALTVQSIASPGRLRHRRLMQGCLSLLGPLFFLESRQYLHRSQDFALHPTQIPHRLLRFPPPPAPVAAAAASVSATDGAAPLASTPAAAAASSLTCFLSFSTLIFASTMRSTTMFCCRDPTGEQQKFVWWVE